MYLDDQIFIFDRHGIKLTQIRATAERSWAMTEQTSAQFAVSVYDAKCREDFLRPNNWVLIRNERGLPDWVGMIDYPITFYRGYAMVNAYTPEIQFFYRRGTINQLLSGNAGNIFSQMIDRVNTVESTPLIAGDIYSLTGDMQETLNPVPMDDDLRRIVERSGERYNFRPVIANGRLKIYCDWSPKIAKDNALILQDGFNVWSDTPVAYEPPLANDILMYGDGMNWESRIYENAVDDESAARYGVRQYSENIQTPSLDTLREAARVNLSLYKNGVTVHTPKVPPSSYNKLEIGVLVRKSTYVKAGFSGDEVGSRVDNLVVVKMYYNPINGGVDIVVSKEL